jgi:hypothetical protein
MRALLIICAAAAAALCSSARGQDFGAAEDLYLPAFLDPAQDFIAEVRANNTSDNAQCSKALLFEVRPARVVVVTSGWHMPRAKEIFDRIWGGDCPVPWDYEFVEAEDLRTLRLNQEIVNNEKWFSHEDIMDADVSSSREGVCRTPEGYCYDEVVDDGPTVVLVLGIEPTNFKYDVLTQRLQKGLDVLVDGVVSEGAILMISGRKKSDKYVAPSDTQAWVGHRVVVNLYQNQRDADFESRLW